MLAPKAGTIRRQTIGMIAKVIAYLVAMLDAIPISCVSISNLSRSTPGSRSLARARSLAYARSRPLTRAWLLSHSPGAWLILEERGGSTAGSSGRDPCADARAGSCRTTGSLFQIKEVVQLSLRWSLSCPRSLAGRGACATWPIRWRRVRP